MSKRVVLGVWALGCVLSAFGGATSDSDVYLLIGQSNMAGRGRLDATNAVPCEGVRKMNVFGYLVPATEPLHYDKKAAGAGLGASFANAMRADDTNTTVVLVPCAFGGSALREWTKGSYMYDQAVRRTQEALRLLQGKGRLAGILWHQGESDTLRETDASTYAARFMRFITDLRSDLGCGDVPLVVGELGRYLADNRAKSGRYRYFEKVNEALHRAAETIPNCACVSSEGLTPNEDILHFNTASLRVFGVRYAAAMKALSVCGCATVRNSSPEARQALAPYVERGEIAGVISVLSDRDYNESWDCLGWADAERKVPMRPDTLFAIFSMTKTFTGCAILIAVDRGILKMDDPVEKYLPEFQRLANKVTIHDCMCHISGVYGGDVSIVHTSVPLREQARSWALNGECRKKIGEEFSYGNIGIATAAACLEVASGVPFERFLKENVLDPLGMKDTTFSPNAEQLARLVKAYTTKGGPFRPAADSCTDQLKFPCGHKLYPMPAAGLYSTPADMIRFSQMLAHHGEYKGRIIVSRKNFDEIWAVKQTPAHIKEPYTVGSWLYGDWFGHEGAMRTDQRANLKTGHSRVFFIQTENKAGPAFFDAKIDWHRACDRAQKMQVPFSDNLVKTHENDRNRRHWGERK